MTGCRHIATLNNGIDHYEKSCRIYSVDAVCPGINTRTQYNPLIMDQGEEMMTEETLRLKNNTAIGYIDGHEYDGVVIDQSNARGRVQPERVPTFNGGNSCGAGVIVRKPLSELTEDEVAQMVDDGTLTVRKLTSLECWRLMNLCPMNKDGSFDDTNYHKASEVSTEPQLYRQAGNSIVVECLYSIFESMLIEGAGKVADKRQMTLGEF